MTGGTLDGTLSFSIAYKGVNILDTHVALLLFLLAVTGLFCLSALVGAFISSENQREVSTSNLTDALVLSSGKPLANILNARSIANRVAEPVLVLIRPGYDDRFLQGLQQSEVIVLLRKVRNFFVDRRIRSDTRRVDLNWIPLPDYLFGIHRLPCNCERSIKIHGINPALISRVVIGLDIQNVIFVYSHGDITASAFRAGQLLSRKVALLFELLNRHPVEYEQPHSTKSDNYLSAVRKSLQPWGRIFAPIGIVMAFFARFWYSGGVGVRVTIFCVGCLFWMYGLYNCLA